MCAVATASLLYPDKVIVAPALNKPMTPRAYCDSYVSVVPPCELSIDNEELVSLSHFLLPITIPAFDVVYVRSAEVVFGVSKYVYLKLTPPPLLISVFTVSCSCATFPVRASSFAATVSSIPPPQNFLGYLLLCPLLCLFPLLCPVLPQGYPVLLYKSLPPIIKPPYNKARRYQFPARILSRLYRRLSCFYPPEPPLPHPPR